MGQLAGYMVTWTTYGSWLQGDEKGYVKNGEVLKGGRHLQKANKSIMQYDAVRLRTREKEIIRSAIMEAGRYLGEEIKAISVWSNHVHVVVGYSGRPIEDIVSRFKNKGYFALRKEGFAGRLWTRGFDKRYCYDENSLQRRIEYVRRHASKE